QTECEIVLGLPGSPAEWVEVYSYPIKDSDSGRVTGVVEFVRDITERKRMEKALQQSEQRYRAVFEQAIDSVVLIDLDTGQIEEFNDKACQNLGYTRQEFGKLKLSDFEAVESPEEIIQHLDKVAKQGIDVFETKHRTKSGEIRDALISAKIIYARGRKLCQVMFRDVTEQKQAKEKLHEYQTKLKSMAATSLLNEERQRRRIANGLHDDIGQKLAVAKFDLLSSIRDGTDTDTAESVKNVCSEIDTMIENVRSMTFKLSNPVLTELGLEAALERHLLREIRDKHGIKFQLNKCRRLAQLNEDISMCLFRSVRELLNNVIKHSNAKNVSVSLDKADGNITIRVNDDGVGFDPVAVTSKINAGSAFGLFSVREQLESFAGELKVESSPGHGSSFTITVPLEQRSK
ncbi:MAG: PAS domain S-box protein, partial [candidate division Zixibacteria bacterium]